MEKQRDKFARRMQRKLEKAAGHPGGAEGEAAEDMSAPLDDVDRQVEA